MTVEIDVTRKAVGITWDTELVEGEEAEIIAANIDTGDISTRGPMPNDGAAVLTYPADYHGSSEVVVTGSEGGEDTGTIEV